MMARKVRGAIVEHTGLDGRTYRALRFTAYGKRRYESLGPVSRGDAESALRHVLADLERGTWRPCEEAQAPSEPEPMPTFREFTEQWWARNERQLAASTRVDYRWRLDRHLLPFFGDRQLDRITFDAVESYIAAKLAEAVPLAPRSVNMTLTLMAAILEGAVERELIARNPARRRGKRRRVRERAPRRTYLDTSEHIAALLAAGGELDAAARRDRRHVSRRAILATLMFAGLRIGELCALRWRDVDLATGWLHVGESKTDAGRRRVKIRGALRDELAAVRATRTRHVGPGDYVFATRTGGRQSRENVRNRVLAPAVQLASGQLVAAGSSPLPEGLTPHSLRRTFASVLYALGEDPGVVMDEMGHTDPALALRVYRQTMRRDLGEKARLKALVEGGAIDNQPRLPGLTAADHTGAPLDRMAVSVRPCW
jgi:integrase